MADFGLSKAVKIPSKASKNSPPPTGAELVAYCGWQSIGTEMHTQKRMRAAVIERIHAGVRWYDKEKKRHHWRPWTETEAAALWEQANAHAEWRESLAVERRGLAWAAGEPFAWQTGLREEP